MAKNKTTRVNADRQLAAGIGQTLGKGSIVYDGEKCSAADIVKMANACIGATAGVTTAKAALTSAVTKEQVVLDELEPILAGIRLTLALLYKSQPTVLANLGIAPRKPRRDLTVKEKSAAVDKVLATRKARGTKGPRQRASIHGAVDAATPAELDAAPNAPNAPAAPKAPDAPAAPSTPSAPAAPNEPA